MQHNFNLTVAKCYNYKIIVIDISEFDSPHTSPRPYSNSLTPRQANGGQAPLNIAKGSDYCDMSICGMLARFLPYSIVLVFFTTHGSSPGIDILRLLGATSVNFNASLTQSFHLLADDTLIKQLEKNIIKQILCLSNEVIF